MKTITLILLLAFCAFPQTQTTGRIAGTVKDQNGALIVGATVTVTNQANGEERTATTDAVGSYAFAFSRPPFITSASPLMALTFSMLKP